MKSTRILSFVAATTMSVATHATTTSHSPVDLRQFITGTQTDSDGRNLLQVFAENCDNDNFAISVKPFDLFDVVQEISNFEIFQTIASCKDLPKNVAEYILIQEAVTQVKTVINNKDKFGDTALHILNKKQSNNPRCQAMQKTLTMLTEVMKDPVQEQIFIAMVLKTIGSQQ